MSKIILNYDSQYHSSPNNDFFIGFFKVTGIPRVGELIDLKVNDYKWDYEVTTVGHILSENVPNKLETHVYVKRIDASSV